MLMPLEIIRLYKKDDANEEATRLDDCGISLFSRYRHMLDLNEVESFEECYIDRSKVTSVQMKSGNTVLALISFLKFKLIIKSAREEIGRENLLNNKQ